MDKDSHTIDALVQLNIPEQFPFEIFNNVDYETYKGIQNVLKFNDLEASSSLAAFNEWYSMLLESQKKHANKQSNR